MITGDAWGGPPQMSAWDTVMWRTDSDPRTRSAGMLLEILDRAPEWESFCATHERTALEVPRLRERVVEPLIPVTEPVWSLDPHFDLALHVHRVRLPDPGTERQLFEFAEMLYDRPMDRRRPLWEAVLVTGLEGGQQAAYLLKIHHSLSDGLGMAQLMVLIHRPTGESPVTQDDAAPRPTFDSMRLIRHVVQKSVINAPGTAAKLPFKGMNLAAKSMLRPHRVIGDGYRWVRSAHRMLTPPEVARSPLLDDDGTGSRLLRLDVPLDDLRQGAKAVGCSLNDAYVAAMLGGLRRWHEVHGTMVDAIPIGMPVSLRKENDHLGGNHYTGVHFAAPLAEKDPARRMRAVRGLVLKVRSEPALEVFGQVSPLMTRLPAAALTDIVASLTTTCDMQVTNIRGLPYRCYLAGAEVLGTYALGPRPGVAVMAAMVSFNDTCCIGLNVNPHVFTNLDLLARCLREGFDEVIALGRPSGSTGDAVRDQ